MKPIQRYAPREEACFRSRCVSALAGGNGEPWQLLDAVLAVTDTDGGPVVVIRHDQLAGAPGAPDEHLVVPCVPGEGAGR